MIIFVIIIIVTIYYLLYMYTLMSCFLQSLDWSSSENLLQGNIGL